MPPPPSAVRLRCFFYQKHGGTQRAVDLCRLLDSGSGEERSGGSLYRPGVGAVESARRGTDVDSVGLLHCRCQGLLEGSAVPGVGLGGAADVQVDQLVEERLSDVAGADPGVVGDLEAELAGNGKAEAVGALAGPPHLELRSPHRERTVGEDRQRAQPFELLVQRHPRDQVVGAGATPRGRCFAAALRSPSEELGHHRERESSACHGRAYGPWIDAKEFHHEDLGPDQVTLHEGIAIVTPAHAIREAHEANCRSSTPGRIDVVIDRAQIAARTAGSLRLEGLEPTGPVLKLAELWVRGDASDADLHEAERLLLAGESLGSLVTSAAAARGVRHV